MATAYTSLLGFALPVTGELAGTWGDTVNNSITQLVEDSVAGTATASVTSGDWTLTTSGSGAANQARCAIIRPTGTPGTTRNVIAPSSSKAYIVDNQSNAAIVFKGAATTGVTVAAGKQALVAWNGSDFVQVGASAGGSNTQVQYNSSGSLAGSANLTFDGSNLQIGSQGDLRLADSDSSNYVALQSPATLSGNYTLTLPTTDGDANQVLTTDGSGVLSWTTPSGGVTTFSAGTTGFTPSTATSGAITLAGTLAVANGGTGQTSYTNGQLLIGNTTGNTLTKATLTAGAGISISNGAGSITISSSAGTSAIGSAIYLGTNFGGF